MFNQGSGFFKYRHTVFDESTFRFSYERRAIFVFTPPVCQERAGSLLLLLNCLLPPGRCVYSGAFWTSSIDTDAAACSDNPTPREKNPS